MNVWMNASTSLALLLSMGCIPGEGGPPQRAAASPRPDRAPREVVFHGACDASGAVPLSDRYMVVADDEDNVLRVYDVDAGGAPLAGIDVSPALELPLKGKRRPKAAELDLEAATRVGERAYWLTSHGRNKKGKLAPARLRLFATTLGERGPIHVVGHAYERLVEDLAAAPGLAAFGLGAASALPPKAEGGLNIEGMTASPDGHVILAFRNPVPRGRALLISLLNAGELVTTADGGPARFGAPVALDLGGRGVRSLSWWRGRYMIIAGHHASGGTSALFTWDGVGDAVPVSTIDLGAYNPEGFFTPEDRDEILVLSDDGERPIDGRPCKKLKDPTRRRFRGVWLVLPR